MLVPDDRLPNLASSQDRSSSKLSQNTEFQLRTNAQHLAVDNMITGVVGEEIPNDATQLLHHCGYIHKGSSILAGIPNASYVTSLKPSDT